MADAISSPNLYDKVALKHHIHRAFDIAIFVLLISLLVYRLLHLSNHGFAWLLALLCESCFSFIWVLNLSTKWNPVEYKTYPERLSQKVQELPPMDMFVTTADPVLEPPIITVNTVLSLLAVDYPVDKLACYVSDDGCSPITCYSLVEASKFAKLWVPFCKKYNVLTRVSGLIKNAPFMLNVDCDMFVNNPQIVRHAMCLLLGSKHERESAFVQCLQDFYDGLKDDPFGNQFVVLQKYLWSGIVGIQGPFCGVTGCFQRRKVIYGSCPDGIGNQAKSPTTL